MLNRVFVGVLPCAAALYLLLIDNTSSPELYAAMAAVLLAAVTTGAAARGGLRGVSPRARWLLRGWRVLAQIPRDIVMVSFSALDQLVRPRRTRGCLRVVPFRHGSL